MSIKEGIKIASFAFGSLLNRNNKSKVLFYHDVCSKEFYNSLDTDVMLGTSLDVFEKHIEIIRNNGYKIVPRISQMYKEVAIMFDDGFRGIWDNREFFYNNCICPTVFLAVDLIGKPGFLKKEEILELQNHGFIFESHSWSHIALSSLTPNELKRELGDSKMYLSKLLNKEVTEICLPLGYYSDTLLAEIKKYGYKKIYSSIPGNVSEKIAGVMETRNLCQFATPLELTFILKGGSGFFKNRYIDLHYKQDESEDV